MSDKKIELNEGILENTLGGYNVNTVEQYITPCNDDSTRYYYDDLQAILDYTNANVNTSLGRVTRDKRLINGMLAAGLIHSAE